MFKTPRPIVALLVLWTLIPGPLLVSGAASPPAYFERAGLPPLCRVDAAATRGDVPTTYDVTLSTRAGCPSNGEAWVRMQSGRLYPWRKVTPGHPATFRNTPWYWTVAWRSQSGKIYRLPLKMPLWGF